MDSITNKRSNPKLQTVRELLQQLQAFIIKWKAYYRSMHPNGKPKSGNVPLTLVKYTDDISQELCDFIGIYICRNKTRRYFLEGECGISFLYSGESRQMNLQFEGDGIARESDLDFSKFQEPLFALDLPWDDALKITQRSPKNEECCTICMEHITNRAGTDCCTHSFCLECIMRWCDVTNTCPICKRVISRLTCAGPVKTSGQKRRRGQRVFPINAGRRERNENSEIELGANYTRDPEALYELFHNDSVLETVLAQLHGLNHGQMYDAVRSTLYRSLLDIQGLVPNSSRTWRLYRGECIWYEPYSSGISSVTDGGATGVSDSLTFPSEASDDLGTATDSSITDSDVTDTEDGAVADESTSSGVEQGRVSTRRRRSPRRYQAV